MEMRKTKKPVSLGKEVVHGSGCLQDKRVWPVKWQLMANAGVLNVEALNERGAEDSYCFITFVGV